jgi:hypothetical protein
VGNEGKKGRRGEEEKKGNGNEVNGSLKVIEEGISRRWN